MSKSLHLKEAYSSCKEKGFFISRAKADTNRVIANLKIADEDLEIAKGAVNKEKWNSAYKLYYDVLHILAESFLQFDGIKSLNHQCLFAYLCLNHPELELSWDFFEKIRTKRNGINYYSQPVSQEDWKPVELQFNLYISVLKKEIGKKLKELEKK